MAAPKPAVKLEAKLEAKATCHELTVAMECFQTAWNRRSGPIEGMDGAIRVIRLFTRHLRAGGGDSMALFERADFTSLRILEDYGFGVYQTFNPTILYVHRRRVAATE